MSKALPVAKLLPVLDVADGFIMLKDGTLSAIAKITGGMNVFSNDESGENTLAIHFQSLLNNLAETEDIQLICVSKRLDPAYLIKEYNNKISFKSSNEKINEFWTKLYPGLHEEWLKDTIDTGNVAAYKFYVIYSVRTGKEAVKEQEKYRKMVDLKFQIILDGLIRCGLSAEEMKAEEITSLLSEYMNPKTGDISNILFNNAPTIANDFDSRLTKRELLARTGIFIGYDFIRHGRFFSRTIYFMDIYDTDAVNIFLKRLALQGYYFQLSLNCHGVNQGTVLAMLASQRKQSHGASFVGTLGNMQSQETFNQTDEIMRAYTRGDIRFIRFNLYLTFYADSLDELNRITDNIGSLYSDLPLVKGELEQETLFKSRLPICRDLKKGTLLTTSQLANTYPFLFNAMGTAEGIIEGTAVNKEIVKINPWSSELTNANQLVMGIAGSGKSFYTNLFLFRLVPWNVEIMIVDRSKSYETICKMAGGEYLYFDLDGKQSINPFELSEEDCVFDDNGILLKGEVSSTKIDSLLGLLDIMLSEQNSQTLPNFERALMQEAVILAYKRCGEKNTIPTMSELANTLLEMAEDKKHTQWSLNLKKLNKQLLPYIGKGAYAPLVDRETNIDIKSSFVVFDTSNLRADEKVQSMATYIISNFLMKRILENKAKGKKQVLAIDEAWSLVRFQSGANFLMNLAKRSRHMGLACIFCTQQIGDFLKNDSSVAIINNCQTITLFKQSATDAALIQQAMALNGEEMASVMSLGQRRYSYSQAFQIVGLGGAGAKKGLVNIIPDAVLYWAATTEPNRDVPLRAKTVAEYSGDIHAAIWQLAKGV